MSTFGIIDFETTGMSPDKGDRATEVAVVIMSEGTIVDRYESLINPGIPIPEFIQSLTGISNRMVANAPDATQVMHELYEKTGDIPLIAHHACFDKNFLYAEYSMAGISHRPDFSCSMLLARRLYPDAPNHKLATLVSWLELPTSGRYHRAMADAEMTAYLSRRMFRDLEEKHQVSHVSHDLLYRLQQVSKQGFETEIVKILAG